MEAYEHFKTISLYSTAKQSGHSQVVEDSTKISAPKSDSRIGLETGRSLVIVFYGLWY